MSSTHPSRRAFLASSAAVGIVPTLFGIPGVPGVGGLTARAWGRAQPGGPPERPLDVLVLGGDSFPGMHIVEAARRRGHDVTLGEAAANPSATWDAVIDASDRGPGDVKAAARRLADRVGQYVYVSSVMVYHGPRAEAIDENGMVGMLAGIEAGDVARYPGAMHARAERDVHYAMPKRATFLRCGHLVGPGDDTSARFPSCLARVAHREQIVCPGEPDDPVQYIDARDLAAFCMTCIERQITGPVNVAAPPEPIPGAAAVEAICRGVEREPKCTWVPMDFIVKHRAAGSVGRWRAPIGMGRRVVSTGRAVEAGLVVRPLVETVRDTWAWLRGRADGDLARATGLMDDAAEDALLDAWRGAYARR